MRVGIEPPTTSSQHLSSFLCAEVSQLLKESCFPGCANSDAEQTRERVVER